MAGRGSCGPPLPRQAPRSTWNCPTPRLPLAFMWSSASLAFSSYLCPYYNKEESFWQEGKTRTKNSGPKGAGPPPGRP